MKFRNLWTLSFFICIIFIMIVLINYEHWDSNDKNIGNRISTNEQMPEPLNVILLGYYRSGSTLTGELLSTVNCSYIYEPLYYLCGLKNQCSSIDTDYRYKFMDDLMNCDGESLFTIIRESLYPIVRKMNSITNENLFHVYSPQQLSNLCRQNTIHVFKTVRLLMKDVLKILKFGKTKNLQIVHLVRDPRARHNSAKLCDICALENVNVNILCKQMELDLISYASLPENIYTQIKYEDLIKDPFKQMNRVFNKVFGHNITKETIEYINTNMGGLNPSAKYDQSNPNIFFGTNRSSGVANDRWKYELTREEIDEIQSKCKFALNALDYEII